MTRNAMYTPQSDNLIAYKTDGTAIKPAPGAGLTLAGSTTYYVPLGSSEGPIASEILKLAAHLKWNAALAATITLESSCFPATLQGNGQGPADVADWDTTAGNWIQENPSGAVVYSAGGASNSVTALTITAGGAAVGAMLFYLAEASARRYRLKVVVTTGGVLRVGVSGKGA